MTTELISQIRATEAQAAALVAKARTDADAILVAAQAESSRLVQAAEADAKRRAAQALEAARVAGRGDAVRLEAEARAEAEQIRSLAAERLVDVAKQVMGRIVKA